MNILTADYYKGFSIVAIKHNIRFFFRSFKFAYQRVTRGFSDWDLWELDDFYTTLFIESLREFAAKDPGFPYDDQFPTYEDWTGYLNRMAKLFEYSQKEDASDTFRKKCRDEAIDMLKDVYDALWY